MPVTTTGLLIILIAIFPGLLGNRVYQSLIGTDWREKDFQLILRLIGFSVIGAALYTVFAGLLDFPPPLHLLPNTYEGKRDALLELGGKVGRSFRI